MIFTTYEFVCFLLLFITVYYLIPHRFQWLLLLIGSYVFYGLADIRFVLYIAETTLTTFLIACQIENLTFKSRDTVCDDVFLRKEAKRHIRTKQRRLLIVGIGFNIGILSVVKYSNFIISSWNSIVDSFGVNSLKPVNFLIPLGISFYTFKSLGYLIDIYRKKYSAQRNLLKYALFVSFFPELIQGPISRYNHLEESLYGMHSFDKEVVLRGAQRVLWGFFKKLVIADRVLIAVNTIIQNPETYEGTFVFVGMILYAIEIYADFTGGIDITIGIAEACGISVIENFNHPYLSKSFKEYWKRWHISMGSWFEEYLFYPISVSKTILRLSSFIRSINSGKYARKIPVYFTSLIVWFATGLWHGASWNFIVWGLLNWLVIVTTDLMTPIGCKISDILCINGTKMKSVIQITGTFMLMSCVRLLDCYRNVETTFKMIISMAVKPSMKILFDGSLLALGLDLSDYIVIICGVIVVSFVSIYQLHRGSVRQLIRSKPWWFQCLLWYGLIYITIITGIYGVGYDANQFIYNQF